MERIVGREGAILPPTVNMHIIGACNFGCKFCYARFVDRQNAIPLEDGKQIINLLQGQQVNRITFAGGEPTLHRGVLGLLMHACELGIVTAIVTNASLIDAEWCERFLPFVRWVVLSLDSADPKTCVAIGRQKKNGSINHPRQIAHAANLIRDWNARNAGKLPVRIKVNIVVTALNSHEDPTPLLLAIRPERVKVLQCGIKKGENDDAVYLQCSDAEFSDYCKRVGELGLFGITVVTEREEDQRESYAMIDPKGCFYQTQADGLNVVSRPILKVGLLEAWREVGGFSIQKFVQRGGLYDPGQVAGSQQ